MLSLCKREASTLLPPRDTALGVAPKNDGPKVALFVRVEPELVVAIDKLLARERRRLRVNLSRNDLVRQLLWGVIEHA